jgi:uncharacterized protein (TIGR02118 family)
MDSAFPLVVEGSTTRNSGHRITTMIRLLVLYGQPKDPASFDKYYHETHVPIAKRMKGLKKWTIGKVQGTPDGKPAPFHYVADLYMESRADFEQLLASPEGQAAVADVPNYATGGATFLYTEVEDVVVSKLTAEEQMALFEKELKENDWGHQPC